VDLLAAKQKGRRSALLRMCLLLGEIRPTGPTTDLRKFSKAKLDEFFFNFNSLLKNLIHLGVPSSD